REISRDRESSREREISGDSRYRKVGESHDVSLLMAENENVQVKKGQQVAFLASGGKIAVFAHDHADGAELGRIEKFEDKQFVGYLLETKRAYWAYIKHVEPRRCLIQINRPFEYITNFPLLTIDASASHRTADELHR